MSRAFVNEQEIDATVDLPDRLVSSHPNDVTVEGMKQLDSMLHAAHEARAAALRGQNRSALAAAARDLRYWSARRATARVVPISADNMEVRFGSAVSIRRSDGREQTFRIVGEDEANPSRGSISHASPMACALMRKCLGDVVLLGLEEIEITAIR